MSYLVQASTLTKIFLPEWHERCLSDPSLLLKGGEPFEIIIPRPVGSIRLQHNIPVVASTLIAKVKERKVEEDEVSPLVRWLTDENEAETDCYGVVEIPIETNVADAIMSLIYDKDGEEKQMLLLKGIKDRMAKNIADARARADRRVLRQCGKMYSTVRETVQQMKKDGKGDYSPSYSEALALEILRDQIKLRRAPDDRSQAIFNKAMEEVSQPGL